MLNTNLLPPDAREALWYEEQSKLITFFLFIVGLVFLVGFVFIVPSYASISAQESGLKERLLLEEGVSKRFFVDQSLNQIGSVNAEIKQVHDYFVKSSGASELLTEFLDKAGGGVLLSYLSVREGGLVTIQGRAATRRDLLGFEKQLREGQHLQDISFPLANIVKDRDIDFSLQGKLK